MVQHFLIAQRLDDVIWNCALRFPGPISFVTDKPYRVCKYAPRLLEIVYSEMVYAVDI